MDAITRQSVSWVIERADPNVRADLDRFFPVIYDDLRRIAHRYMSDGDSRRTLQPTALVHEAFVRLHDHGGLVKSEGHALALGAVAMRCILVDYARGRLMQKRGGGRRALSLNGAEVSARRDFEILELHDLINRLAELDARRARVVELRFFGGMTNEQIAEVIGVARSTVAADWRVAQVWLRTQIGSVDPERDAEDDIDENAHE